jgi:hypothetical protein
MCKTDGAPTREVVKNTASGNLRSGSGNTIKNGGVAGEGVRLGHAGTIH